MRRERRGYQGLQANDHPVQQGRSLGGYHEWSELQREEEWHQCLRAFSSMIWYINSNPTMQQAREGASANSSVVGNECKAFQQNNKANLGNAPGASAKGLLADIDVGLHVKNKQRTE